jgi:hypothetical protein
VFGLPKVIVIFLTVDVDPKSLTVAQVGKKEITAAVIFRLKFLQLFHIDFLPGQQRHRWRYLCEAATSLVVTAASAAAGSASLVQLKARKQTILSAKNFVFIMGFRLLYLIDFLGKGLMCVLNNVPKLLK